MHHPRADIEYPYVKRENCGREATLKELVYTTMNSKTKKAKEKKESKSTVLSKNALEQNKLTWNIHPKKYKY